MKKATSFLLALVMLVSMLPGTAVPAAAAADNGTLEAYYTYVEMTTDGKLTEEKWLLKDKIGSTPVMVLCNEDSLFVGMQTTAQTAEFTVEGKTVKVDLAAGTVMVDGVSAGSAAVDAAGETAEVQIKLAALGMDYNPAQTLTFAAKIGSDSFSGKLNFAHKAMLMVDDFTNTKDKTYASSMNKVNDEVYVVEDNGSLHYKTNNMTDKGTDARIGWMTARFAQGLDLSKGMEMVLNVDFNDLIVPAADMQAYWGVTGFTILNTVAYNWGHGFIADADGNIYVAQYEDNHPAGKKFDTGLDLPAKDVNVRIVVTDDSTAEIYVNGKNVAKFDTTTRKGTTDSGSASLYIWAATSRRDLTATRKNDVLLHDMYITQEAPAAQLAASAVAKGMVAADGQPNESFWTLNGKVGNTKFGTLVDEENLYIALDSQESAVNFVLGEQKATAKLGKAPSFALGFTMGSTIAGNGKGQYEIAIPLRLLQQENPNGQKIPFTVSAGGASRGFQLALGGGVVLQQTVYAPVSGDGKNDAVAYLDVAGLKLDGNIKDLQWYTPYKAAGTAGPGAEFGFQWNASTLYVGGKIFTVSRADKVELTVGGKTMTADLIAETATAGSVYLAGQTVEWAIPLSELGLSGLGAKTDYEIKVTNSDGTTKLYGELKLIGTSVVLGDTATDLTTKDYTFRTTPDNATWKQMDGYQKLYVAPSQGANTTSYQHYALPVLNGNAYDLTVDIKANALPTITGSYAWRGICWEIRQEHLQARYALRDDGKGNILMDSLYMDVIDTVDTGKDLGDRFTFTISVDKNNVPSLYIDGEKIHTFRQLDRTTFTVVDSIPFPQLRCDLTYSYVGPNDEGKFLGIDAEIYNTLWTQASYADDNAVVNTALDQLTEEGVLAGSDPEDVTRLNLVKQIYFSENGITVPVTWKAVDTASGQVLTNVNVDTGAVTKTEKPVSITLIASVAYGEAGGSKEFMFKTKGRAANGKVALLLNDADPFTGEAVDFTVDSYEYFDASHNSLVYDQGASKQFNRIVLHDLDEFSRVGQRHLGVFVSEDGKTWTKVTGWLLHQDGKEYTLYNLNAKARYVKVHSYLDSMDMTGEVSSFYNAIQSMMTVSNEQYLPGAGGAFAHKAEIKVTTGEKDSPVFISIASLGAKAGQYKADGADFRFTVGDTVLAHWYNGKDGFYVRVPSVPATVTAQWGCSSAKDFSDPEGVFEVAYGNVSLINLSKSTYDLFGSQDAMGTHGRPFTFPNGDVVVVGRRWRNGSNADIVVYRSTDGGFTFTERPIYALSEDRDSAPMGAGYRGSGFGGFMWDEELNRLYIIGYSGRTDDTENDYRLCLTYSDDYGYTWSEVRFITDPVMPKVKDNDYVLQSSRGEGRTRAILYCDGLKLQDADGDGPNVDYVIVHALTDNADDRGVTTAIYSKDGGSTWIPSDTLMNLDISKHGNMVLGDTKGTTTENGMSESGFAQLDDGTLYVVIRAQQEGNFYLSEAFSYDYGKTWTHQYSKIPSSNTSPMLMKYGEDRLLLYASRTGTGMINYRRTPMYLGVSSDNYQTYDHYLDLTFSTAFDSIQDGQNRMTQPGIAISPDGNRAFVSWYDHTYKDKDYAVSSTVGFLVEEFDEMIYGTKGGYEDFEDASLKYMGWLNDLGAEIKLTREASVSGMQSMKIVDANSNKTTHAVRQVPAMKAGTVGAKVMAPASNQSEFVLELKAAYNFVYLQHALMAVSFAPDGTVSICYKDGKQAVAKVEPGTWNDVALSFDIAGKMGKLTVNGKVVKEGIKLMTGQTMYPVTKDGPVEMYHEDVVREICAVQFSQVEATQANGDCLYVDDFYAIELTEALNRAADNISFADVKKGDWYYDAVSFAVANGIMSGYNAEKFGPNDTLNRAMVVQVLYNKEGQPALNGLKHNFSDVPASQWFNNAVTWGSNRGVVSGFGGGVFKPEDAVTIEQVAVILCNYSGAPAGYGDISKVGSHSDWAANALKWAVDKGLLENVPFTNATEKATRAQTAQMLTNFLRNS